MGKSRKNQSRPQTSQPLMDEPSEELKQKLHNWQWNPGKSPDEELTDEEIRFIKNHMSNTKGDSEIPTGELTRVERAYHFIDANLKEGDILDTNSVFRAFSREPDATTRFMMSHMSVKEPIVIYRTHGNIKHYNITKHTDDFEREKESWVETGKLKISKITHYTKENDDVRTAMIRELHLNNYPKELEYYSLEHIFDPTPYDVMFVDLEQV